MQCTFFFNVWWKNKGTMFLYFVFSLTHETQKDSIFFSINIRVFLHDGEDSLQFNFCHVL